ncbi:MAG: DUF3566 domain-containing protein [Acidimicrobiales bacterium]
MPTEPQPVPAADDTLLNELAATVASPDAAGDLVAVGEPHTAGRQGSTSAPDATGGGIDRVLAAHAKGWGFAEVRSAAAAVDPEAIMPTGVPLRARQVERLVRRVSLWSVLRISLLFYACLWLIFTVAGVILWRVASSGGVLDNAESFIAELLSMESFSIDGGSVLWASVLVGVVLIVAGTAMTVLLAVLFNLISEITGGVRVAVVELETARPLDARALPDRWSRRVVTRPGSPVRQRVR